MKQSNRIRGSRAHATGQAFEQHFFSQAAVEGIAVTRMPDGCRVYGPNKLIRVQTPFDWILSLDGKFALLDTKSYDSERFPHSGISPHQVIPMYQHSINGVISGYIVQLRKADSTVLFTAEQLFLRRSKRGSIEKELGIILGTANNFSIRKIFK